VTHTNFVIAAFAITGFATLWLVASSWLAMRKSEALADDLRKQP
jgi:hypothetical protein